MRPCAVADSGWLVRLESRVRPEPSSVPVKPSDTSTTTPPHGKDPPGPAGSELREALRAEPGSRIRAIPNLGHESPAAGFGVTALVSAVSGADSWPPMSRRNGGYSSVISAA